MKKLTKIALLGLSIFSNLTYAAQSNFQISPPPIAAPSFKEGEENKKVSATYANIAGSGLNLSGAGVNLVTRKANSNSTAVDFSSGIFVLGGSMDVNATSAKLASMSIPLSVNLEFQPLKSESADIILFGGPMMNVGFSSFSYQYQTLVLTSYTNMYIGRTLIARIPNYSTVTDTMTSNTTTLLYGGQGGAQASIKSGNFTYSPFAMVQFQQGSAATSSTSTYSSTSSTSIDIPSFVSSTYGFDILYRPWNMTLSSMLQIAPGSGGSNSGNAGFKTTIISLSWNF